jgi:hypothetical protein
LRGAVLEPLLAGLAGLVVFAISAHGRDTPYNNYVLLADAFRHGRVAIDWPGPWIDALQYHGAHYVIEAPAPVLFVLPQVLVVGKAANQTLAAIVAGALALAVAAALLRRLEGPVPARPWLLAFLAAGTDLWWCSQLGDVWMLAHVAAVLFTLLALFEAGGHNRPWLLAIWAALAALSRFPLLLAVPLYAAFVARSSRRAALVFLGALVPFALFWLWYNQARWGTWADVGYVLWYREDAFGTPNGLPVQLSYLPYELHSFFVQRPDFVNRFPYVIPNISGVALTFTSPALGYAFFARRPGWLVAGLWAAALVVAVPSLLYYVNGFAQYGMRHALDFEPFLFVLMALAARAGLPAIVKALIAWSCLAGAYGVWYWTAILRPGS